MFEYKQADTIPAPDSLSMDSLNIDLQDSLGLDLEDTAVVEISDSLYAG